VVRLFLENTNSPGPVTAVRWCVDRIDLENLKKRGITDPFFALVIAQPSAEENLYFFIDFKVVPLDQAMEFIEFRSAGEYRIFGFVIWVQSDMRPSKKLNDLREYIEKYCSSYRSIEFIHERLEQNSITSRDIEMGSADIVVPEGYFAKEPSRFEKWWVNLWYESKPKNQCQFRKRRMLAYSIQPFVVIFYATFKSLLLFGQILLFILIGARKIKYSAFLHPFTYELLEWEVKDEKWTSWFFTDSSGKERNPVYFFFVPMVQLILSVISLIFAKRVGGSFLWWLAGLNAVIALLIVVILFDLMKRFFPEETEEEVRARRQRELEKAYAEYQDMICVGVPLRADIAALPVRRKTFYLKFRNFQRRVCLPFSK